MEKPKDDSVTPTFAEVARMHADARLLPYLMDHTLAHIAAEDLFKELDATLDKLVKMRGGASDQLDKAAVAMCEDVAMDDVLAAALEKVAGPSLKDVAGKLWPLTSALGALAMRHHLAMDINFHNDAIGEGDVATACRRATYLLRIAQLLSETLKAKQPLLWRAKLVVEAVKPGEPATTKGSLTWVEEVRARADDTVEDAPDSSVRAACCEYANLFDDGGYLGGTFAGMHHLVRGAKPSSLENVAFSFGKKLVLGEPYDAPTHALGAMVKALGAQAA